MALLQGAYVRCSVLDVFHSISFVCSMSITRRRSAFFVPQTRSIVLSHHFFRNGSLYKPGFSNGHHLTRHYSTPTPVPPTEKSASDAAPLAPRVKKPKVELHPAPVRPKPAPPSPAPAQALPPADAARPAQNSSTASNNKQSVVKIAKQDIEDAKQHGIMKPPPENANRVMKLVYTAIEYFVCSPPLLCSPTMNPSLEILPKRHKDD
jgi:LETM1 and EF-hand domain-containing protein 1, mitochondrial